MKRFLIIVLCIALLLVGCNRDGNEADGVSDTDTSVESTETAEVSEEKIYAVKDGAPLFTIVYGISENATHADYMASVLKSKTGVTFKVALDPERVDSGSIIYVGLHSSVEEMYKLYGDSISYDGYGAVYKDGDIYICGYNETAVGKAAKKFLSEMIADYVTKGESGRATEAYFAKVMFFLKNPTYEIESPTLLGLPMSSYTLVTGESAELSVKQMSKLGCEAIGKRTGAYIKIADKCEEETRIELAHDKTMELFDYTLSTSGKTVSIRFGGICALYSAFEELCALSAQDTTGGISLTKNAKQTALKDHPLSLEAGSNIRVMSANVLGTGLEEDNQCPTEIRAAIMAEYIMAFSPDSVGLQEYYGSYTAEFMSAISEKYSVISFEGVGVPMVSTIYLKDKYTVNDSKAINIKVEEYEGDPKAQNYYFTWAVLTDGSGGEYIHANLHLEYRTDVLRLKQCEMIKAELESVMEKYPNAELVITGDYNSKISNDSPIFDAIKGEYALECAEEIAPEGKRDDDRSSFHTLCSNTSIITSSPSALDHVMVSTDTLSVKLHRIIYDALICHASDHCPVVVDIARK